MSYSVTFEDKPGYLHARVTGSNSRENVLAYLNDVYTACVARNSRVVLIEEYLLGPSIPLSSVFQVVDARAPQARHAIKKIGYVDTNPEHDLTRMEFAEDVAVNRGVNMRLFPTVADAERWLRDDG